MMRIDHSPHWRGELEVRDLTPRGSGFGETPKPDLGPGVWDVWRVSNHFGIVAEAIGSASIGKAKLKFLAGATENYPIGVTGDFRVREMV
jgi:hypothetical protein